jgi:hypothetical protein
VSILLQDAGGQLLPPFLPQLVSRGPDQLQAQVGSTCSSITSTKCSSTMCGDSASSHPQQLMGHCLL